MDRQDIQSTQLLMSTKFILYKHCQKESLLAKFKGSESNVFQIGYGSLVGRMCS